MAAPTRREPLAFLPVAADGALQTMSSMEIAELCDARHNDVVTTIERLFTKGVLRESRKTLREHRRAEGGRPTKVYDLTKRDTLVVVSGYNDELRAKIIDRWEDLERASRQPSLDLNNPADLRLLLANYANDNLELQGQIADLTPKAEALDRLALADGSFCITDAAKTLQVRPKDLFQFLRSHRWIYTRPGGAGDLAYQSHLTSGCLEHKTTTIHRSDGSEKVVTQCRVTPKGLARLAKELEPSVRAA